MSAPLDLVARLFELRDAAACAMEAFPQYDRRFETYTLVRVTRDVRTKLGLAFEAGEYAIARDEPVGIIADKAFRIVWSARNKVDTAVPVDAVVDA